mgnify:CR=1 FL=1
MATKTKKKATKTKRTNGFAVDEFVVYPTHGVGQITGIEEQEIAGTLLKLFVVNFEKEKMTLRVPINKAEVSGMRALASADKMKTAMTTLKGRARVKRTMWSRRVKANPNNPIANGKFMRPPWSVWSASWRPSKAWMKNRQRNAWMGF